MRCYTLLTTWTIGFAVVACASSPGHVSRPVRLATVAMAPQAPWELEAMIHVSAARTHPTCSIGVWLKNIVTVPDPENLDGYSFTADYYELLPCEPGPTVYAVKGYCTLHNHHVDMFDMHAVPAPCPGPVCGGLLARQG